MNSPIFCIRLSGWMLIIFLSPALFGQSYSTNNDYRQIFGKDYDNALRIIDEKRWWADSLEKDGIDPHFALSIVFPELIRYSSIEDYIQVKALEVLYVQYGRDYSDFSIALFQMKPSFAEKIEADLLNYRLTEKYPGLKSLKPDTVNTIETRKQRIIRLKDEHYQVLYLEAFIRIMDVKCPELDKAAPAEKILFYSAAYNAGYDKSKAFLLTEIDRKRFYTGMIPGLEKYPYPAIAQSFYLAK